MVVRRVEKVLLLESPSWQRQPAEHGSALFFLARG